MARTRIKPTEQHSLADWFLANLEAQKGIRSAAPGPKQVHEYINFLWPVGLDYSSPLNPFFLVEATSPAFFQSQSIWMSRDGLVPLLWFFRQNPDPRRFRGKLLVHHELSSHVPPAWRKACGTYELVSLPSAPKRKPKGTLFVGIMMDTFASLPWTKKFLKNVADQKVPTREILGFLPGRFDGWGSEHRHDHAIEFAMELAKNFGTNFKGLTWTELDAMSSFQDFVVVDVNEGLLCKDNYLVHLALSRGATLQGNGSVELAPGQELIQLSPFHGMKVSSTLPKNFDVESSPIVLDKRFKQFELGMRSEANRRFPWPTWFASWSRAASKLSSDQLQ